MPTGIDQLIISALLLKADAHVCIHKQFMLLIYYHYICVTERPICFSGRQISADLSGTQNILKQFWRYFQNPQGLSIWIKIFWSQHGNKIFNPIFWSGNSCLWKYEIKEYNIIIYKYISFFFFHIGGICFYFWPSSVLRSGGSI